MAFEDSSGDLPQTTPTGTAVKTKKDYTVAIVVAVVIVIGLIVGLT